MIIFIIFLHGADMHLSSPCNKQHITVYNCCQLLYAVYLKFFYVIFTAALKFRTKKAAFTRKTQLFYVLAGKYRLRRKTQFPLSGRGSH